MALPPVVERATWEQAVHKIRQQEKIQTRQRDELAAARRRLPVVAVPNVTLEGSGGMVDLVDLFEGRRQLITYHFMWRHGSKEQCEGCSLFISHFASMAYLNARDTTFAVVTEGDWQEARAFRDSLGWTMPWYSSEGTSFASTVMGAEDTFALNTFIRGDDERVYQSYSTTGRGTEQHSYLWSLLDITTLGRQESWEDSPEGWPQTAPYKWWARNGRTIAADEAARHDESCCA